MKRLVDYNDEIINDTVLKYYGVTYSEQRDIADVDRILGYAILQAIKHAVRGKYHTADEELVNQYGNCLMRYVMHLHIDIAMALTQDCKSAGIYRYVVNSLRQSLIKDYAKESDLSNEEIYAIVIDKLLGQLEQLFFDN